MSLVFIVSICASIKAQTNSLELKVYSKETKEALLGATVYIKAIDKGSTTDSNGFTYINGLASGVYEIEISYVGFETLKVSLVVPTKKELKYYLAENGEELEEIILNTTRSSRTIQKTPSRVEFIGLEELGEKAVMNPTNISMVLRESTGIQMQQTSLSSGNMNIRIQGLDGRFTQLLRDGFPLYSGFSSGLSIMQIPPLDLKQFEIIKGSASTLYGGGAISGLVNLISKTPEEDADLEVMLTQTQALGSTLNIYYSNRNEKFGTTLYGSGHYQKIYDPENDDFSNLPKTKSLSFNPKFFYYPSENSTFQLGLNANLDDRIGGDVTLIESGETGNHTFFENNISRRFSSQASYITQIDEKNSMELRNSFSYFNRELKLVDYEFKGEQWNSFSEFRWNKNFENKEFVFGANLYTTKFDELTDSVIQRDSDDITVGAFVNSIIDLSSNWVLEAGFRTDYSDDWGLFALPRISVLYKNDTGFSSRLGGGLGYKNPDLFTEDAERMSFQNILPIGTNDLEAETSYGVNYDFNYKNSIFNNAVGFSINQLFYVTAIDNGLLLQDSETTGFYEFVNANDLIVSKGAETNIKFTYKNFKWFLNYALIDTQLNYIPGNPQKPLTAKHNAGSVVMYETEKWRMGYETYYTGEQLLSNDSRSSDFFTMGFMVMRNLENGSLFVNFENFTDKRQSKFSPLVSGTHNNPEFSEIYAPTDGFIFSIGFIWKPFGSESHH